MESTDTTQSEQAPAGTSPWVLIVEDDTSHRRLLADLVSGEGYRPVTCATVAEALQMAGRYPFVAAIFDQRLPDGTGTDLLQKIRQKGLENLRVIIHTGYGSFESAKDAVNLNAFAYVEKLSDPEQLINQLHRAVGDYTAQALQQRESELASVMNHAPDIICRVDRHGLVEFINRPEPGIERQQVVGQPFDRWVAPDQREAMRRALAAVLEGKPPGDVEVQSQVSGRWYSLHMGPIGPDRPAHSVICIAHDISDRKAAELALRRHQEQLERRVAQRTEQLHRREQQERWFHERLTLLNRAVARLTTCTSISDLCRSAVEQGCRVLDLDRLAIWLFDLSAGQQQGTWGIDEQGKLVGLSHLRRPMRPGDRESCKDGCAVQHEVELVDARGRPVGRGNGLAVCICEGSRLYGRLEADNLLTGRAIRNDHAELLELFASSLAHLVSRLRAEERASHHQAELARVSRLATVGEMASGLAHELNQPLSAIVNFAQGTVRRLQKGRLGQEELIGVLQRAADQALRAGKIIQRMRSFVKPQEPGQETVDLGQVVRESLGLLEGQLTQAGVQVRLDSCQPVPPVHGDAIQIEQVLINLILNAIDAMEQTDVSDRLLTIRIQRTDRQVQLTLADRGCGLPPQTTEIFEPFVSTKPQGMGMGLSISRSIIHAHGGELLARPNPGGGAQFICLLPIARSKDKSVEPEADS